MEELTRAKSINALAQAVAVDLAAAPPAAPRPALPVEAAEAGPREQEAPRPLSPAVEARPRPPAEDEACPRHLMTARLEPFPRLPLSRPEGLFIITADALLNLAAMVADALQRKGAKTAVIEAETLLRPGEMERIVAARRRDHGPVRGVIHLAPLTVKTMPDSLTQWRAATHLEVKSFFDLLKLCAEDLQRPDELRLGRVLAATMLGGLFGRDGRLGPGLPSGGGCLGLLKTLDLEWPRVLAKALDFDGHLSPQAMAEIIIDELLLPGGELEVGYAQGRRHVFTVTPFDLAAEGEEVLRPDHDWVILVTGGARGVTAEAARALVRPGARLILVGRSPEPGPEPAQLAGLLEAASLRRHFIDQARLKKKKTTPAAVEARVGEILNARAIRANVEALRRAGGLVEYQSADVRDEILFGGLIDDIYARYGRLDAVVHGAGVIADKLIVDKDRRDFDRVFDTKVDGAFVLAHHLRPDSLKLMVFFSSTAGRFGNRGQSDYGAANETLNRFAWWINQRWAGTRVASINWGPWRAGMASPEVNRRFLDQGIMPIEPEDGRRFFETEVLFGGPDQVEVIAGRGPWERRRQGAADPYFDLSMLFFSARTGG